MGRNLRALALSPFTPVIGKTYPLRQAADAMRDLEAGRARGRLVITVAI